MIFHTFVGGYKPAALHGNCMSERKQLLSNFHLMQVLRGDSHRDNTENLTKSSSGKKEAFPDSQISNMFK